MATEFFRGIFAIPSDSDSVDSDSAGKAKTKSRSKSKHRRSNTPLSSSDYSSEHKSRKNGKHSTASKHPSTASKHPNILRNSGGEEHRRHQHANDDRKETSSRRWRSKFKSKNRPSTGADNYCRRAPERTEKRKIYSSSQTRERHEAPPTKRDPINVGDSIFISQKFLETDCEVSVLTMPKELVGLSEDAINYEEVDIDIVDDVPPPPPLRHDTASSAPFAADPPGYVGTALLRSGRDSSAKAKKPLAAIANKTVSFAALPSSQHREEKFPFLGPSRDMYFVEHEMRSTLSFIPELFSSIEGDSTYTREWEPGDRLLGEGKRGLRLSEEFIDFDVPMQSGSSEVGPPSQENSNEILSHEEATERLNQSKVADYRHRTNWKLPMLSYRPSKTTSLDSWQVTLERQKRTDAAIVIQSSARVKLCRMLANKAEKGAVVIQRFCRVYIFKTRFKRSVKVRRSYSSSKWAGKFLSDQSNDG